MVTELNIECFSLSIPESAKLIVTPLFHLTY